MARLVSFIPHTTWIIYIVSAKNEEDAFSQISITPCRNHILRSLCPKLYHFHITSAIKSGHKHKHLGQTNQTNSIAHTFAFANSSRLLCFVVVLFQSQQLDAVTVNCHHKIFMVNRRATICKYRSKKIERKYCDVRLYVSHIISCYVCYFFRSDFVFCFIFPLVFDFRCFELQSIWFD